MRMSKRRFLGGRTAKISMNHHIVTIVRPKKILSYEEGVKRIDKLISRKKII